MGVASQTKCSECGIDKADYDNTSSALDQMIKERDEWKVSAECERFLRVELATLNEKILADHDATRVEVKILKRRLLCFGAASAGINVENIDKMTCLQVRCENLEAKVKDLQADLDAEKRFG